MNALLVRRQAAGRRQSVENCRRRQRVSSASLLVATAVCLCAATTRAGRPTGDTDYLGNVRRTGYTAAALPPPYQLVWAHTPQHAPRPAWHEPAWKTQHIDQDYVFNVSAGSGQVYFGSSADHAVHALDVNTGQQRWEFFTEGPVRFAPAVAAGRVYAASDDGYLYCLDADRGTLIWKCRPAVPDQRMVGNDQVIARWPSRCGPLASDGRVYATFGIWSPEGIFVSCLEASRRSVFRIIRDSAERRPTATLLSAKTCWSSPTAAPRRLSSTPIPAASSGASRKVFSPAGHGP